MSYFHVSCAIQGQCVLNVGARVAGCSIDKVQIRVCLQLASKTQLELQ